MAFFENLSSLEAWAVPPSFSGTWFSDALARDTDVLTKALQRSLSAQEPETSVIFPSQESVPVSISEPETVPKRARNSTPTGKISKRKPRVTKRSPTTFITADPANFREMVQQVTGVQFRGGLQVPVRPVLRPEPQRAADLVRGGFHERDTSALLAGGGGESAGKVTYAPDCAGLDSGDFPIFPTLESWHGI